MNSDSTVTGGFNGGASYGSGSDGGVGMTVAWTMAYLRPSKCSISAHTTGSSFPKWGPTRSNRAQRTAGTMEPR